MILKTERVEITKKLEYFERMQKELVSSLFEILKFMR